MDGTAVHLPARGRSGFIVVWPYVLAWRVALQIIYWFAPYVRVGGGTSGPWGRLPGWLHRWFNSDGGWYVHTAVKGYSRFIAEAGGSNTAFFPLYPMAIRVVWKLTPLNPPMSQLVLAHLFTVAAVAMFHSYCVLELGRAQARRAVAALLLFPTSFFLVAPYAESLLLLTFAGVLLCARRGQWVWASVFGAMATATKPTGLAVVAFLAVSYLTSAKPLPRWRLPLLAVPLAGLGAYSVYLWIAFGRPLLWLEAQRSWARAPSLAFWSALAEEYRVVHENPGWHDRAVVYPLDVAALLLALLAAAALARRGRWPLATLTACVVLIPTLSGLVESMFRYAFAAVGIYVWIASAGSKSPPLDFAYRIVAGSLLAFGTLAFCSGVWVA